MTLTLLLAVYGSILSTILAAITVQKYLNERRILSVEPHFSFDLEKAYYNFVIANISARPFTIIDCMFNNLAKTQKGELVPDWGIGPKKLSNLFGDQQPSELVLPLTLQPGEVLFVGLDSGDIIEQFSSYAATPIKTTDKWTPTVAMELEIVHSMSKKIHSTRFELQEKELRAIANRAK